MIKISVTGPKTELKNVIEELHDLELLHIDDYDGELETGNPFEEAEDVSQLLVDVRSLISKLPDVEDYEEGSVQLSEVDHRISDVKNRVETIENNIEKLKDVNSDLRNQRDFFEKLEGADIEVEDLEGTETLDVFVGKLDSQKLKQETDSALKVFEAKDAKLVFYRDSEVREVIDRIKEEEYNVVETDQEGSIEQVLHDLKPKIEENEEEKKGLEKELGKISKEWRKRLESTEKFLTEKVEKSEAPLRFGTMERSFVAEGWVPKEDLELLKDNLNQITSEKIHIEEQELEDPPVKHENTRVVKPFESLTDLISVPKYGEVDPSLFILLTFPLFFGLMIGDAGYGLTSAIVFYAGMKKFPQASEIFKALLWTSAATVFFGLLYGEMFGFQIYESPFYRADWWEEIFYITIGIGLAHVNLGLLIGAYNEYIHHGLMEAIFAKISWIFLQIGAVAGYLTYTTYGTLPGLGLIAGIFVPTILMLYKGEGVEGVVEIPSLISNVLSYLRLFGVCMAAYTLAGTANAIASPAFASGSLLGITAGVLILMVAHTILTFVKIMEGFLQGIRLHYVEMFGWFYEGGGKKYAPFGAKESV